MNPSFDERIKNLVEAQAPPIGLDEVTGSAPADGAPDNRPPRTRPVSYTHLISSTVIPDAR